MAEPIRVLHFINQFFGGIGGEEHANVGVEVREEAVGPGRALQLALGDAGTVVATVIGGDNYMVEHEDEAIKAVGEAISRFPARSRRGRSGLRRRQVRDGLCGRLR